MVHLNLALDKSSFIEKFPSTSFNISQLPNSNLSYLSKVTFFSTLNLSSSQAKNFQFFGALGEVSNKYSVLHPKFWEPPPPLNLGHIIQKIQLILKRISDYGQIL